MHRQRSNHLVAFLFVLSAMALLTYAQITKAQPAPAAPRAAEMAAPMAALRPAAPAMGADAMTAPVAPPMTAPMAIASSMESAMAVVSAPAMAAPAPVVAPAVVPEPAAVEPAQTEPEAYEDRDLDAPVQTAVATPTGAEPPAPSKATPPTTKVETRYNWWQTLLGGVVQLILLVVGGIAAPLGVLLVRLIAKKAKISDAEQQQAVEMLVSNAINLGINYATQMANKLGNNSDAKAQRISWATTKAAEVLKEYGIPEKSSQWIMDRIEAQLGLLNGTKPVSAAAGAEPVKAEDPKLPSLVENAPAEESKPADATPKAEDKE